MSLYSWGENRFQELGLGEDFAGKGISAEPSLVSPLEDADIVQVACGNAHSLVLNRNGEVYAFGRGQEGQLGLGPRIRKQASPHRVTENGLGDSIIVKICAGDGSSAAITNHGELYEWGFIHAPVELDDNGNNPSNALPGLAREVRGMSDRLRELLRESFTQYLQGGDANRMEGMDQDQLDAEAGILVVRTRRKMRYSPVKSPFRFRVRDIALGYGHTLITVEPTRTAWTKGYNDRGQLGVGTRINEVDFVPVQGAIKDKAISAIACGNSHNLAVVEETGECYAWGSNVLGQLGISEALADQLSPTRVLIDEPVIQVSAGSYHSVALTAAKNLYSFGHAEYGQHGSEEGDVGDYGRRVARQFFVPRVVGNFQAGKVEIIDVRCGQLFTCALDKDGALWTWGFGAAGNLGHGMKMLDTSAHRVEGLLGQVIRQVSAGHKHVICITEAEGQPFALKNMSNLLNGGLGDLSKFDCVVFGKQRRDADNKHATEESRPGEMDACKAHRAVLLARCPRLAKYFVSPDRCELPTAVPSRVVNALLEFIYADVVRSCPPHKLVDLQELASNKYLGLPRLEALCALQRYQRKMRLGYNFESAVSADAKQREITSLEQVPPTTFSHDMLALLHSELDADIRIAGNSDEEDSDQQQSLQKEVPPGHTAFSWFGKSESSDDLPPGHTRFTFGPPRRVFLAHSYLLSRYPFFRAMLSGQFKEQVMVRSGGVLKLSSIPSSDALKSLLEWVYSGTIDGGLSGENVADVLRMSSALGLDDLVRSCERFLMESLDKENAADVLLIAEETGLSKISSECLYLLGELNRE